MLSAPGTQQPDEKKMQRPAALNSYVTVANVDETTKKAESLGAKAFAPLFDVMDAGRIGCLQDPPSGLRGVAGESQHRRADSERAGALCWTELTTSDTKAAEAFYNGTARLGSQAQSGAYRVQRRGTPSIGMMLKPPQMPAHIPLLMPHFQVANCDSSTAKAKQLGGNVMVGPQDIPNTGRFTIISDPQGAVFAVFEFTEKK